MSDTALGGRFSALWRRLGGRGSGASEAEAVLAAWREPHRVYHGLDHLRDCLARLDEAPTSAHELDLAEAALWYHDLVYRPGASDNESRSADAARTALLQGGAADRTAGEVARLVGLTDHATPPSDPIAALVCDVDLSILGRSSEEFATYERQIREEYRRIPEDVYRVGRRRVLERLLAREQLFVTPHFRDRYEDRARRNLHRSLGGLAVMDRG